VKALLLSASEQNHRSMSREAEFRIERSFEQDRLTEMMTRTEARTEALYAWLVEQFHSAQAQKHILRDSKGRVVNLPTPRSRITRRKMAK